jgi:hypothetical protein
MPKMCLKNESDWSHSWARIDESKAREVCFASSLKSKKKKVVHGSLPFEKFFVSWMIEELDQSMSFPGCKRSGNKIPENTFARSGYQARQRALAAASTSKAEDNYPFRESIRRNLNPMISNGQMFRLE